jgi:ribose transport system substrate-binding protein
MRLRSIIWSSAILLLLLAGCGPKDDGKTPSTGTATGAIKAGKYEILDTKTDLTDRARAKQNAEDTLTKYPDINCLVGLWSYNGPMILSAVKDAKKEGKVNIVCFDEEVDTLAGIKDGYIKATIVQQPYEFGYQAVKILAALARGDKSLIPANKIMEIPVKTIEKDNVDAFTETLNKQKAGQITAVGSGTPPTGPPVQVAFLTNNSSDFWSIAKAGVTVAEKEFNAQCEFLMPPKGSAAEQQRMIETLIAKKVTGMSISPNDAENQVDIINRACAVMNVICHDSDAPKSKRLCYVGTNNYKAGREAGKAIKKLLPDGGKLMLFVGRLDAQNAKERREGIIDELSDKPMPE